DGSLERGLSGAEAGERDEDAIEVEAAHALMEAGPLLTETMRGGDADVVEREHRAADRARAEIAELAAAHARRIERDGKRRDTAGLRRRVGAGEQHHDVGDHAHADAGLLPPDPGPGSV